MEEDNRYRKLRDTTSLEVEREILLRVIPIKLCLMSESTESMAVAVIPILLTTMVVTFIATIQTCNRNEVQWDSVKSKLKNISLDIIQMLRAKR